METGTPFRYNVLADTLEARIREGTFLAGEKLPSIRQLHRQTGLSITTVYHAFTELEKRGMVSSRQKSGYFVKPLLQDILAVPQSPPTLPAPRKVNVNNLAFALIEAMVNPDILQLGGALVATELLPVKALAACFKSAPTTVLQHHMAGYGHYMGHDDLRRQIAQRLAPTCGHVGPDDMVVTNGCIEAVSLCLQAIARPGDTVIVESPTFPWFLQLIQDSSLRALEIPADPQTGIDLAVLDKAIASHCVKACIFISNFNNPQGFCMSNDKKKALVTLLNQRKIPIIEDDIYGDLYFDKTRPKPLKAFDRKAMVLYCSSFSKNLSPGLRIGYVAAGRFHDRIKRLKLNQSISVPGLTQWGLTRFLKEGNYDRHLRKLRTCMKNQVANTALAVSRFFPRNTKISAPSGGLALWVQLEAHLDSLELFRKAFEAKIAIMPGIIFAGADTFKNCLRISCGMPYDDTIENGIKTLADIVRKIS